MNHYTGFNLKPRNRGARLLPPVHVVATQLRESSKYLFRSEDSSEMKKRNEPYHYADDSSSKGDEGVCLLPLRPEEEHLSHTS